MSYFGEKWYQVFSYPGAQCIDISPFDSNLLVVSVEHMSKNPGIYLSRDRGKTWTKNNTNIGIPHKIEDVKFNILAPSELWIATLGCGFYKGNIKNGDQVQVVDILNDVIEIDKGENMQLNAKIINPEFLKESIIWKSENETIAKVTNNGKVMGVSSGLTKIWATTKDGRFADFATVTIKK